MVKEGGPTLLGSDDKEVWQSPTGCGRYLSAARRRLVHGRKLHLKAGDFPVLLSEELALFLNLLQGRPELLDVRHRPARDAALQVQERLYLSRRLERLTEPESRQLTPPPVSSARELQPMVTKRSPVFNYDEDKSSKDASEGMTRDLGEDDRGGVREHRSAGTQTGGERVLRYAGSV